MMFPSLVLAHTLDNSECHYVFRPPICHGRFKFRDPMRQYEPCCCMISPSLSDHLMLRSFLPSHLLSHLASSSSTCLPLHIRPGSFASPSCPVDQSSKPWTESTRVHLRQLCKLRVARDSFSPPALPDRVTTAHAIKCEQRK